MRRAPNPTADWRRYLKPPPPPARDVQIFTWGLAILGITFFTAVWITLRSFHVAPESRTQPLTSAQTGTDKY